MLTRKKILLSVAAAALIIRLIFAFSFHNSFFVSYHLVPGLDMQTLLAFSEWGGGHDHSPFFTFHRVFIFLNWFCCGQTHCVWNIFILQSLIGILGAICITDLILKFSRARKIALVTGMLSASYLPFLVYEFSILQENFMMNFTFFAFWATFNAWHKRFNPSSSIILIISFFAMLAGRPAAVLLAITLIALSIYKMYRKKQPTKVILPIAILIFLLSAAAIFNYSFCGIMSQFYNAMPYTIQYNLEVAGTTPDTPPGLQKQNALLLAIKQAASRTPAMFKYGELPENQNIYFWCEKLPLLDYFPAPGLIIPLAVAGIMIVIFSGSWKKRYGLLLLPLITMVLPLCAREPIGRYRLMLVPYLFIIAACATAIFFRIKDVRMRGAMLFAAAIGAFFSIHNGDVPQRIRPYDYLSWAIAMENSSGTPAEEVLEAYYDHWQAYNFHSDKAFSMLMDKCLGSGRIDLAAGAAQKAITGNLTDPDYIHYYLAWCAALQNDPQTVNYHLTHILHPENLPADMHQKYIMLTNDTRRILTIMEN